jgi:hypothetical protein
MSLYTVVSEGYDVSVYGTLAAVVNAIAHDGYVLSGNADGDAVPATPEEIASELKKERVIRLYEPGKNDWVFRVEKHRKAH